MLRVQKEKLSVSSDDTYINFCLTGHSLTVSMFLNSILQRLDDGDGLHRTITFLIHFNLNLLIGLSDPVFSSAHY